MPLDRLVLILVTVIVAAGLTVWLGTLAMGAIAHPVLWTALIPVLLVLYVLARVILDRLRSREDDRYDRVPRE